MKELFNKDNFVFCSLEGKAKKSSLIVSILLICLFVLSSLTFMNFLYCFSDVVGSIVSGSSDVAAHDAIRSVPVFVTFFETLWMLLLVHGLYRSPSQEKVERSIKKCLIATFIFSAVIILYVIIGRISGTYLSLVEGSPSALYPLDSVLYSLLFLAISVIGLFFKDKVKEKFSLELTPRTPVVKKVRFIYCFFVTLWMLFALFSFSAFAVGIFIIDFKHEWSLFGLATLLVYFVTALSLAVWELYYNELKEEAKAKCLLPLALVGLVASTLVALFYFVSLSQNLDAPSNMGFGVFPVAFAASVNIATILVIITPILVSLIATLKGVILRNKK